MQEMEENGAQRQVNSNLIWAQARSALEILSEEYQCKAQLVTRGFLGDEPVEINSEFIWSVEAKKNIPER
jgi:hypothetical protein